MPAHPRGLGTFTLVARRYLSSGIYRESPLVSILGVIESFVGVVTAGVQRLQATQSSISALFFVLRLIPLHMLPGETYCDLSFLLQIMSMISMLNSGSFSAKILSKSASPQVLGAVSSKHT